MAVLLWLLFAGAIILFALLSPGLLILLGLVLVVGRLLGGRKKRKKGWGSEGARRAGRGDAPTRRG